MTSTYGIYTRISLDRHGESESPERQEAACRAMAEQRGWEVAGVYADRDTSAFRRGVRRPEYDRMLRDLSDGAIDGVVVWKLDRLTRQGLTGVAPILDLVRERGVTLVSVKESLDTSTPMGRGMVGMLASIAEQESQNISERVRLHHAAAAKSGRMHGGGTRQYGLTTDGQVVPDEAAVIREAMDRVLGGESLRSIAADLNARGLRTPAAGKRRKPRQHQRVDPADLDEDGRYEVTGEWRSVTLGQMLRSPRLAGKRRHGEMLRDGQWEAIITQAEHLRLLDVLGDRVLTSHRSGPTVDKRTAKVIGGRPLRERRDGYLLTGAGLIVCGRCGSALRGMSFVQKNGTRLWRYQCLAQPGQRQCGRLAAALASVDDHVVGELLSFLARAELRPVDDTGDEEALAEAIAVDSAQRDALAEARFFKRSLSPEKYEQLTQALTERIGENQARLDAIRVRREERVETIPLGDRPALDRWWAEAGDDERRAALRQAIRAVTIKPAERRGGNVFDTRRVGIDWNWGAYLRVAERFEETATEADRARAKAEYQALNRENG